MSQAAGVTVSFSPNPAVAGQTVRFTWSSRIGSICEIEGVPGITFGRHSGSYSFVASENLSAYVMCEYADRFYTGSSNLTVSNSAPKPVVNVSYSPSTIVSGQATTFSWSSSNATSCSTPAGSGTSGSTVLYPSSSQTTSVTCSGAGGSTTASASVTVQPAGGTPSVSLNVSPTYLYNPGSVTVSWNSTNTTSCDLGGAVSGSINMYRSYTDYIDQTCYGPGGSDTASVLVTVQGTHIPLLPQGIPQTDQDIPQTDLAALGIDLKRPGMFWRRLNLNRDGDKDLIVVDSQRQVAYILLAQNGRYPRINKIVRLVSALSDIKAIHVPANGGPIRVRVER
ncbi:hypothetical protein V8J88_19550 [Massilia sp. W12]|uniref:hypothetical protein n=1 Tax=Massilia sp. W12 TaxID=3126507 RepID=UPI0030D4FC0A